MTNKNVCRVNENFHFKNVKFKFPHHIQNFVLVGNVGLYFINNQCKRLNFFCWFCFSIMLYNGKIIYPRRCC